MFFENFPTMSYKIDDKLIDIKDIFRRVAPLKDFINNETMLEFYTIRAGERPEDVAFTLYNDQHLHWTILVVNKIIDPYNEWYYTNEAIQLLTSERYGAGNEQQIHHYCLTEDPKFIVDWDATKLANGDITAVTNLAHEETENESRQNIKVISPENIGTFVNDFKRIISK
tara:strand:+ start:124 stop:633 length:510 start_codon:yes stop_codon:yes gene_type:complete